MLMMGAMELEGYTRKGPTDRGRGLLSVASRSPCAYIIL